MLTISTRPVFRSCRLVRNITSSRDQAIASKCPFLVECGDGWTSFDNSCYKLEPGHNRMVTSSDGQNFCSQSYPGSHLFVPNSKDESAFVGGYVGSMQVLFTSLPDYLARIWYGCRSRKPALKSRSGFSALLNNFEKTYLSKLLFMEKNKLYFLPFADIGQVRFIKQIHREINTHLQYLPGTRWYLEDSGDEHIHTDTSAHLDEYARQILLHQY